MFFWLTLFVKVIFLAKISNVTFSRPLNWDDWLLFLHFGMFFEQKKQNKTKQNKTISSSSSSLALGNSIGYFFMIFSLLYTKPLINSISNTQEKKESVYKDKLIISTDSEI